MATKKKPKEPLVRCNGTMTESQYLSWIRSALRSKSLRWPPRAACLVAARRPYKGDNARQKWEYECAICRNHFSTKEVAIDHYPLEAGSILCIDDIGPFVNRLYCEVDNLRCLCHQCHSIYTLSCKNGITFEQARIQKEIIRISKLPKQELLAYLEQEGYSGESVSNDKKRRDCVEVILNKGEKL